VPARAAVFASAPDLDTGAAMVLEILRFSPAPQILAVTEPDLAALVLRGPVARRLAVRFVGPLTTQWVEEPVDMPWE